LIWRHALVVVALFVSTSPAWAQEPVASFSQQVAAAVAATPLDGVQATPAPGGSAPPAVAVEYSDAYRTRAKIHKIASFTTLPLFAAEGIVGSKLYNARINGEDTSTLKSTHLALATGIGGLFAVNSVTGVWNLVEARKDPNRGHLPLIHSLLALGADASFVATAAITPGDDHEGGSLSASNRGTHRTMAFTSMGLATASYLVMLIGNR
jgi:hypothetical protein